MHSGTESAVIKRPPGDAAEKKDREKASDTEEEKRRERKRERVKWVKSEGWMEDMRVKKMKGLIKERW